MTLIANDITARLVAAGDVSPGTFNLAADILEIAADYVPRIGDESTENHDMLTQTAGELRRAVEHVKGVS